MIVIRQLKPDQLARLKDVFENEFDSDLPESHNSTIFGAFENGKLVGFILSEAVQMIGQIYVVPEKRGSSMKIVKELVDEVKTRYDGKTPTAAVASEPRFANIYTALGMQKIDGTLFRKNI